MRMHLTRTMGDFCCGQMANAYKERFLHISEQFNIVHMGNIGTVYYCPYCGKKIEIVNDIP